MKENFAELNLTTLISEKDIQKKVQELGAEITKLAKKTDLVVVCVLKGSFVFYSDLIRAIDADIRCEFLGVSSYGNGMKTSGEVKLTMDLTSSIEGKDVLLVEDIVDTGLTMDYLIRMLKSRKPKSVLTSTLLLKPDALKTKVDLDYIGFKIGNEFVVGYGLDYQGFYRNLPYVARVNNMN